jgi:hypothetical protein
MLRSEFRASPSRLRLSERHEVRKLRSEAQGSKAEGCLVPPRNVQFESRSSGAQGSKAEGCSVTCSLPKKFTSKQTHFKSFGSKIQGVGSWVAVTCSLPKKSASPTDSVDDMRESLLSESVASSTAAE